MNDIHMLDELTMKGWQRGRWLCSRKSSWLAPQTCICGQLKEVKQWKILNNKEKINNSININVNVKFNHSVFYESPRSSSLFHHKRRHPLMNNYHCDHHHSWTVTLIFISDRQHFLLKNHHPHHHHRHEHWRKSREPILAREWLFHLSSKNPPPALRAFCIYPIFISRFEVIFLIAVTVKDVVQI